MFLWLSANWGTILVAAVLAVILYAAVRKIVSDRRAGRSSCGGSCGSGCSGCAGCAGCHRP